MATQIDPNGPLKRFGIPLAGGMISDESRIHLHQRWGPLYDNYDLWLRKIKKVLDPEGLADWSAYVPRDPSEYPSESEN
jgi:hypothetical protein